MFFIRVALYARVSTEDQARHGLSVEAQVAALREWAKRGGHTIVGEYIDAGISGKKPPSKRPALSRFFFDLETGAKVDLLAFCKLDRFFRSVKLYYQAVDVLDRYHVAWQAIQEDYETLTASGRMKVNIMLSVAENEADRTSERIKTVFERKIELGQPITQSQPLGFKIEGKKLVHDENAPAALAAFEYYAIHGNVYATRDMIQREYGIRKPYEAVYRMLTNTLYIGSYRGNDAFCEPIVPRDLWEKVQDDMSRRRTSRLASGSVYLFSGLLVCAECGRRWTANPGSAANLHRERYRCPGHLMGKSCTNNRTISEYALEQQLIAEVTSAMAGTGATLVQQKKAPTVNKHAINAKLERLKELYIDGDISKEEYQRQRDKLRLKLNEETPKKPVSIQRIIGDHFSEDYGNFEKEQKKLFWRSIVDHITIDKDLKVSVFFIS